MPQPTHTNPAQKFLYDHGKRGIDPDFANVMEPHQVRRHGVRRLGRQAVAAVATTAALTAGGALFANSFDRSPTQKHYVETVSEQEEQTEAEQQQEPAGQDVSLPGEVSPVSGEGQIDPSLVTIGQERDPAVEAEAGPDVAPQQ